MVDICALCGRETEMTFEHIPPKSCFNKYPVKSVKGSQVLNSTKEGLRNPWDVSGLEYQNMQQGMGKWSLCSDCNPKTGAWYGRDYANFVNAINNLLIENRVDTVSRISFNIFDIYPLRIVKQMLSMICSINQELRSDERIGKLAEFVLDKYKVGLDAKEYRIYFFVARNYIAKYCPLTTLVKEAYSLEHISTDVVSELFIYPIGVVVCFSPRIEFSHFGADITSFCDLEYDQKCEVQLSIPVLESYNVLPCDYRSMEEITACMNANAIDGVLD